jgi:hypothetical protein
MQAARNRNTITLSLSVIETQILLYILQKIATNYQLKPEDLDPKVASAWYSTRGCQSAGMSSEETREWLQNLQQYRSAHLQHIQRWSRRLAATKSGSGHLPIKLQDAPILLTVLNDHRLLMAAKYEIGQKEMDAHSLSSLNSLPARTQTALAEIHFLACMIEQILACLPENPAAWTESL